PPPRPRRARRGRGAHDRAPSVEQVHEGVREPAVRGLPPHARRADRRRAGARRARSLDPEPRGCAHDLRHARRAVARVGARAAADLGPLAWCAAEEVRYRARRRLGRGTRHLRARSQTKQGDVTVKILVPVKRVPDPTQKAKVKDGHIDLTGASWIVNTFDEYAVETALRLLENGAENTRLPGGEIVVVTLGPDDAAKELRTCLAMGADRAIHVVTTDAEIDSLVGGKVLSASGAAEQPDLVVMGKQAVDGDANQVGQMLAGKLGWPQATFAASIELAAGKDRPSLLVGREVDGGVEYKRVPAPAVITVDLRI